MRLSTIATLTLSLLLAPAIAHAENEPVPQIFAPGVVSGPANDGSPTFSPDGKTLYFTRSGAIGGTILESHLRGAAWSTPDIAPFSGEWNDEHPSMAPDGSYLVFVSTRPTPGTTQRMARVWRVDRTPGGWGAPAVLPATVNFGTRTYAPSVASDGTIYFLGITLAANGDRQFQMYRSRFANGTYAKAEPLPFSSPATADVDPEIAPDQSYLVFASSGRRTGDTHEHLYVTFARGDGWSVPVALRYAGDDDIGGSNDNEPNIAPGGTRLFFSSDRTLPPDFPRTRAQAIADLARIAAWDDGNTNAWELPLDAWIAAHRNG